MGLPSQPEKGDRKEDQETEAGFTTDGSTTHPPSVVNEKRADKHVQPPHHNSDPEAAAIDADPPSPAKELGKWSFYTLIASIVLGALLIALNATVLGTAIPSITADFGSVDDVGWYASSYLIANCAMSPLVGRLYRLFPMKAMFIAFVAVFEVGSLVAARATSSNVLIVARAISGIGGSGILNGGQSIIAATVPIAKRSLLNGAILGCFALGQAIGPLVGGVLTQVASWRWCFYINLPIGGIVIFMFTAVVRLPQKSLCPTNMTLRQKLATVDFVGFGVFAAACVMFLTGLEWGGTSYAWDSANVVGLITGGLVTFVLLGFWFAHKGEGALIPPRLLRNRKCLMIAITSFIQSGATITALYWLPVWFQAIRGANPLRSGEMILPLILSQLVASVICGALVQRTGYYLPEVVVGNALVAVGAGLTSTFDQGSTWPQIIGYQILMGAGRGLVLQLLVTAIQANVPRRDASIASAYVMFAQYLGGAFFASIAKTVFTTSLESAVKSLAPGLDPDALVNVGVTDIGTAVPAKLLEGALMAYNQAIDHVFLLQLAAALTAFVTGWGMGWKNLKKIKQENLDTDEEEEEDSNGTALTAQHSANG
ncbi:MFS general substrate transporter [Xylariaceae sp. FL0804]|nr:MFS general substrate transporter [Xylariaceae sp. FL0804]